MGRAAGSHLGGRVILAAGLLLALTACANPWAVPADRAVLVGHDADGDGVRDDVADSVRSLPVTPAMKDYLAQRARVEQQIMSLDTTAADARDRAYAIAQDANRLISCVPATLDLAGARAYADQVQALVENTDERRRQVDDFSALLDGRDFPAPTC